MKFKCIKKCYHKDTIYNEGNIIDKPNFFKHPCFEALDKPKEETKKEEPKKN